MTKISASILAADFAALGADCTRVLAAGANMLHIDVMDGHFVPNLSLGIPVLQGLKKALPDAYYDVHLMIDEPVRYAPAFVKAGADLITFHYEAVADSVQETIDALRSLGVKVGASLRPGTPVETLYPYLKDLDLVLVMSVEPGFGGQSFRAEAPARLAALHAEIRRQKAACLLEVDGGVNAETAPLCTAAGADWLVAGSALFGAPDAAALVQSLRA